MHHWTDSKIRMHAFCCLLGISLLNYVHRQAKQVWPQITIEKLEEELGQIRQLVLLYPPQGAAGPCRVATVMACESLIQKSLAEALGLDKLSSTQSR